MRSFLRNALIRRDFFALGIVAILLLYSLYLLAIPLSPTATQLALERYHLRLDFSTWASLHLVPAMYNFENQVMVRETETGRPVARHWINHHPPHAFDTGPYRVWALQRGVCYDLHFHSAYRSRELRTSYRLCPDETGQRLQLLPLDEPSAGAAS